ncbi:hypothetical protein [Hyphomicrobium sp.]|uniref:tetratricopeptide repeat protein n=1 Tax=Hyphomicrobium sp. TaxID=82 RepID=UPI002E31822C|nr:hypothetical protein [Hyphomicrobium sp.]HEX2839981.1 hypothetical protein [Hyphomicrobium sp.]
MRAVMRCLPVVGVGALVMGFLALPGSEERITMLLRDGKTLEARNALESLYRAGDRRPQILLQVANLDHEAGKLTNSIRYLEAYTSVRPDDPIPLQRLVEFYRVTGQLDQSIATLERLFAISPSPEIADKLLGFYQLHGRLDAEEHLLRTLINTPYLKSEGLVRLGAIAANKEDFHTASTALALLDSQADIQMQSPRITLFHVLIEQRRYSEAFEKALNWTKAWKDRDCALDFVLTFARAGQGDLARDFAKLHDAAFRDFTFSAVDSLIATGFRNPARKLLADWISESGPKTGREARRFVELSSQLGDVGTPYRAMFALAKASGKERQAMLVAEAIADGHGSASAFPFRTLFSQRTLRQHPLFAAKLALADGNVPLARQYFATVDYSRLARDDRHTWIALGNKLDPNGIYRTLIYAWRVAALAPEFRVALADIASARGDWRTHDAALRAKSGKDAYGSSR